MQEVRRKMEVSCIQSVTQVEVAVAHLGHRSRIGQDVALRATRQNHRDAGELTLESPNTGEVRAARAEALQTDFGERVGPDRGTKGDLVTEGGQIVREDRGRTSQRDVEILGYVFTIELQSLGQTIHNHVQIQFANNADIEIRHSSLPQIQLS